MSSCTNQKQMDRLYQLYCGKSLLYMITIDTKKKLYNFLRKNIKEISQYADFVTKNSPTIVGKTIK